MKWWSTHKGTKKETYRHTQKIVINAVHKIGTIL